MAINETHRPDIDRIPVILTVNGRTVTDNVPPELTLLDFLRDWLGLKGAKRSCDMQVCGACTVLVNGKAVSSCTFLAFEARNAEVITIEGLAQDGELHPLQQSFIDSAAFQCGFCTPGMILAAKSLLDQNPHLPVNFGKWETAYRRYRLWGDDGCWERIVTILTNEKINNET